MLYVLKYNLIISKIMDFNTQLLFLYYFFLEKRLISQKTPSQDGIGSTVFDCFRHITKTVRAVQFCFN